MKAISRIACVLIPLFCCAAAASAEEHRIDLHAWGYKTPMYLPFISRYPAVISVSADGRVAAGFVTRDRKGLATRELPPFSLHVLQFSSDGSFLDEHLTPTSSWTDNSLFFTADGNLLVRTGERLRLFSASMTLLAERQLQINHEKPIESWRVFPTPARDAFLLYNFTDKESIVELLNAADLQTIKSCALDPYDSVTSVSNRYMSWLSPSLAGDPWLRQVTVGEICGDTSYHYGWHGDAVSASLVGDDALILAGASPPIEVHAAGGTKVLWRTTFQKGHDQAMEHVETSADGATLVVAVRRFVGGSRFLDIPPHLTSIKLIVYKSLTGRTVKEFHVSPKAPGVFAFSLSPDGRTLAVYADGNIDIVALPRAGSDVN